MRERGLTEPVELQVPAQKNSMLIIRLTTAGVMARSGLTVDRLDDMKMAVEEACTCLIEAADSPKRLKLVFSEDDDGLHIRICTDCACGCGVEGDELDVVRCILESLADGVKMCVSDNRLSGIDLRVATCM